MAADKSANTRRNYEHAWAVFTRWCTQAGREALPAATKTLNPFAAAELERGLHVKTIRLQMSGIVAKHRAEGAKLPDMGPVRGLLTNAARALKQGARRRNRYSTPLRPGVRVDVSIDASHVPVYSQGEQIARHERCYRVRQEVLALEHYLGVLEHKPGLSPIQKRSRNIGKLDYGRIASTSSGRN